jgi:hypothetical protein
VISGRGAFVSLVMTWVWLWDHTRWVGILAFGEGWHNNHHTFEFSARHGLEWWQVDGTYGLICALQASNALLLVDC